LEVAGALQQFYLYAKRDATESGSELPVALDRPIACGLHDLSVESFQAALGKFCGRLAKDGHFERAGSTLRQCFAVIESDAVYFAKRSFMMRVYTDPELDRIATYAFHESLTGAKAYIENARMEGGPAVAPYQQILVGLGMAKLKVEKGNLKCMAKVKLDADYIEGLLVMACFFDDQTISNSQKCKLKEHMEKFVHDGLASVRIRTFVRVTKGLSELYDQALKYADSHKNAAERLAEAEESIVAMEECREEMANAFSADETTVVDFERLSTFKSKVYDYAKNRGWSEVCCDLAAYKPEDAGEIELLRRLSSASEALAAYMETALGGERFVPLLKKALSSVAVADLEFIAVDSLQSLRVLPIFAKVDIDAENLAILPLLEHMLRASAAFYAGEKSSRNDAPS
jgi:hypothetical protein